MMRGNFREFFIDVLYTLEEALNHCSLTAALKNELLWWGNFVPLMNAWTQCATGIRWPEVHNQHLCTVFRFRR